ncbi:T-cell immunomodulatory protein [Galendromus occidentalis]|uniref:T-cell immunomodulatory protein n=1 Tax=Galendromus occidentalis TaxID=34638 RepID=A0AAJ7SH25_9ACAR|nr:T-cell immunomodulatory protein [Galendromus occidentalis]
MAVRSKQAIAKMLSQSLLLFLVLPLCWGADDHFRDITKNVFGNESGYLAAFADFNSDKSIDVFVLIAQDSSKGFTQIDLNQALISRFSEEKFTRTTLLKDLPHRVDSIIPADFDGDRIQDVLLYSKETSTITIYWGTGDYANATNLLDLVSVKDVHAEPSLFDFDGDRIVDILTSNDSSRISRRVITCEGRSCNRNRTLGKSESTLAPMAVYHSNSFVDLNGDLNPDLLISTEKHFEIWIWKAPGEWELSPHNRPYPEGLRASDIGQSVLVDFDSSGKLSHLVQRSTRSSDQILVWVPKANSTFAGNWQPVFTLKSFKFWTDTSYQNEVNAMMALKSADLDQDGYPDFMAIYVDPSDPRNVKRGVVSLLNRPCDKDGACPLGRTLTPVYNPGDFKKFPRVTNLGFFDIRENGKMDVLVTTGDLKQANWSISALENTYAEDACFIKVITVSGLCAKDRCIEKKNIIEYGYNQPGPVVTYSIIDSEGKMRSSMASQLYQTSHGSLQLPYILFGIGLSPNFVESLEVRMPGLNRSHQWTQIIPNSQMLVIPSPATEPSQWQNKLFITPSRKMLVTGITLLGVVVVNVFIILALHMMEKKADKIERAQQAHRFNFDAM